MFLGNCTIIVGFNTFLENLLLEFYAVNFSAPFRFVVIPDYEQNVSTLYRGLESK
jgi:hypothetical protein